MAEEPKNNQPEQGREELEAAHEAEKAMLRTTADLPFTSYKFAECAIEAAKLHEASYSAEENKYTVELEDACNKVFTEKGIPQMARIAYLCLYTWWNDTLIWCEMVTGRDISAELPEGSV